MSQYGSTRETSGNPSRHDVLQRIVDTVDVQDSSVISERSLLLHPQKTSGCHFGIRHLIAFLGFLGFANVYAMRVNLSVAIVAMVNSSAIPHVNTTSSNVCPASGMNNTDNSRDGEFVWTEAVQGTILGSFFWGYILTNLAGGRLAEVWGACKVMGLGVLGTALFTLLSPVVARWNFVAFIVLRVLEGMTEGVTFPAMSCLLARWIPPLERSQTIAMVYAGSMFGTVVSLPLSGLLCDSTFLGGWPAVFYVFGGLGVLWSVAWLLLSSDSPDKSRFISEAEKLYIGATLNNNADASSYKVLPVPWLHILRSLPFYAILVAHTTQNWLFYTLLTEMPTYMKNILHFDIKKNALLSASPYLVMWLVCLASGFTADYLRRSGVLSTTSARKIFNSIGMFTPAACLIAASYSGCRELLTVVLLVLAVGTNGAVMAGFNSSHLDVAPNFAGTLMGITNTMATIPGFVAPIVVGHLVSGNETLGQWRLVFFIASALIVCGNIFYIIFYDGETQPWNEPQRCHTGSSEPEYEASCNNTTTDASHVQLQE